MTPSHGMSSADAAWLHMDRPTNLMVINSVLWFDEPVDWDAYKAVVQERLVERFDRFRQCAVEGITGPHWEDAALDLTLHFHHVALPAPGDRRALEAFVSDRIATPLDRSRPLWDVYLIDGFGAGAAVLTRIHHCIADGIALARVMLTLTDGAPAPTGCSRPGTADRRSAPSRAWEAASCAIRGVRSQARLQTRGPSPSSYFLGSIRHRRSRASSTRRTA
jgi:diacylglycerol O-acyltransferase / wax synthase